MKKAPLTIRATLLLIVSILNLLIAILVSMGVYRAWGYYQQAQLLKASAIIVNSLYMANKNLSLSRATTLSLMYSSSGSEDELREELHTHRRNVDRALGVALAGISRKNVAVVASAFIRIENKFQVLVERRAEVDHALGQPLGERDLNAADRFFGANTALIAEIQRSLLLYSREYQDIDPTIDRHAMFNFLVWELAEYSGQEYAIVGQMIAQNKFPNQRQREQLIALRGNIEYGWQTLRKFYLSDEQAEKLMPEMEEARTQYFFIFEQVDELINGGHPEAASASYPISIELWLGMSAQAVDSLLELQEGILLSAQHRVDIIEDKARLDIIVRLVIFVSSLFLSFYCWFIIASRVIAPINAMVSALYTATVNDIFEMPSIRYYHDEIGKLARVLEVFRFNSIKLKQSNDELERFAFLAAHDLKSPLRAVDNISQWLEEDLGDKLPDTSKRHLQELRRRVALMDKLLDDTLTYARINSKSESKPYEAISGQKLLEEIIQLLALPAGFSVNIGRNMAYIELQKFPLWQVLYNLINNALKHHDKDTGTITVDVELKGNEYTFSVADDGPGIDPRFHQKIFEMFQTLKHEDHNKGHGMGLAMVRKIVVTYGGKISVDSALGKGSVFRFSWPKSAPYTIREHTAETRLK